MDWLDLLAVQGTLKSLLQHHSSKASSLTTRMEDWTSLAQHKRKPEITQSQTRLKRLTSSSSSKHHRARKGLSSTKATFLLRQRFILRIFYISLDLFWFFHFWAGSVRRGNHRMEGTSTAVQKTIQLDASWAHWSCCFLVHKIRKVDSSHL